MMLWEENMSNEINMIAMQTDRLDSVQMRRAPFLDLNTPQQTFHARA